MIPASQGIKDILVSKGLTFGGTADWAVYIGRMPDLPVRCICVTDSGGKTPNPRWLLDYPSVQIMVRGLPGDYQAVYTKCQEIKRYFLGFPSQTVNGDKWDRILMPSDPGLVGFDQNDQPKFALNLNLTIEPAAAAGDNRSPL
jgi:hypothetical protein